MSSLAASRSDNFYHHPDWDPSKKSRKKFHNAKGHNQYEQYGIIRFELPYDGWCEKCGRHYGKGTRFNAKKVEDGKYFRTKIYRFEMRCHSCPQPMVIATDPKNTDYDFRVGIKKKEEEYNEEGMREEGVDERVQAKLDAIYKVGGHKAEEERQDLQNNPMMKLQRKEDDKKFIATESERMAALYHISDSQRRYDYDANAVLRQSMRKRRREEKELEIEAKAKGLEIKLLPAQVVDADESAALLRAEQHKLPASLKHQAFRVAEKKQLLAVKTASIFGESSLHHQRDFKPALLASTIPAVKALAASTTMSKGLESASPRSNNAGSGAPTVTVTKKKKKKSKKKINKDLATISVATDEDIDHDPPGSIPFAHDEEDKGQQTDPLSALSSMY